MIGIKQNGLQLRFLEFWSNWPNGNKNDIKKHQGQFQVLQSTSEIAGSEQFGALSDTDLSGSDVVCQLLPHGGVESGVHLVEDADGGLVAPLEGEDQGQGHNRLLTSRQETHVLKIHQRVISI